MVHFFVAMLFAEPAYLGWDPTVQLVRDLSVDSGPRYDYTVEDADGTKTVYRTLELLSDPDDNNGVKSLRIWKVVEIRDGSPYGDAAVLKETWRHPEISQEGGNMLAVAVPDAQSSLSEEEQEKLTRGVLTVLHHGDVIIRPNPETAFTDKLPMHFNNYGKTLPVGRDIDTGRRVDQGFWTKRDKLSRKRVHYRMVVKEFCTSLYEFRWKHEQLFPALAEICEGELSRVPFWRFSPISLTSIPPSPLSLC